MTAPAFTIIDGTPELVALIRASVPKSDPLHFVPGTSFFVAVASGGEPMGMIGYSAVVGRSQATGKLRNQFVIQNCRGQGIGRALTLHALAHLRREGFVKVEAILTPDSEALYKSIGAVTPSHTKYNKFTFSLGVRDE